MAGGDYVIADLAEGTYFVMVTAGSDYGFVAKGAGGTVPQG